MKKTDPAISVSSVSFSYGDERVVDGVSFSVPLHSLTVILGPNGSGKTTLLRILLGLLRPQEGRVQVLGMDPREARSMVGYVPQRFTADRSFPVTVREFLHFSHPASSPEEISQRLAQVGVREVAQHRLGTLSGGQLQRVLIARAMMRNPRVLFLDEPVSGIDTGGERDFYQLVQRLREEERVTIVMVSHEIDVVHSFATQVLCMNKALVCSGIPEKVLTPHILQEMYGAHVARYRHARGRHRHGSS